MQVTDEASVERECGGPAQLGEIRLLSGDRSEAKPICSVLEVVEEHDGEAYRAVYTVRLAGVVYALHASQKKSKSGIKTPQREIELVRRRLKTAEAIHAALARQSRGGRDEEG